MRVDPASGARWTPRPSGSRGPGIDAALPEPRLQLAALFVLARLAVIRFSRPGLDGLLVLLHLGVILVTWTPGTSTHRS